MDLVNCTSSMGTISKGHGLTENLTARTVFSSTPTEHLKEVT